MSHNINQSEEHLQAQSEEIERFAVFRFPHSLQSGIKRRIKCLGCTWNALYHGWICPIAKQDQVHKAIQAANLKSEVQIIAMPKGVIPTDPKIAARQTRLELLEEEFHKEDRQLLQDVYHYNSLLRPADFADPPSEEDKSEVQIRRERDFHDRWVTLQKMKETIEQERNELSHFASNPGEKIFDSEAPLLIAEALIQECFVCQEQRTLQHCSDIFWKWDGIKYIELNNTEMRQIIYNFLRDAKKITDKGSVGNFNPSKYKVDQVIDALRAICHQNHHPANGAVWLDGRDQPNPQYLVSFQNGLLNIAEWLENPVTPLLPHTPLLLNVNSLTFNYDPHASEPQEWLKFLNALWPDDQESQQALQEWAGYILVHDTRLHKILLIIGPPRSGKGTIGRVFRELIGVFNVVGPTLSSLNGEFGLQPFLNKMLALISDARLNSKVSNNITIERLLSISGEDPLTINRKFLPSLTVQLPTRIMMMSNEIPDMRDPSGALANRYLVLTLLKSWLGAEDISLHDRLCKELPGILLWALKGLVRLQIRSRFIQPTSSNQTIEELEAMTSPIRAFISERCEIKPKAMIPVADLFDDWRVWCSMTGYPQSGNIQSFGKNLRAAFPQIEITRLQDGLIRERYYKGIAITHSPHPSADTRGERREEPN